jgi:hypothetical protein
VRLHGAASSEAAFRVASRLNAAGFRPMHTLADGLAPVLEYFVAR